MKAHCEKDAASRYSGCLWFVDGADGASFRSGIHDVVKGSFWIAHFASIKGAVLYY